MRRRLILGALVGATMMLIAADAAQAQVSFSYGRGGRGGRSYGFSAGGVSGYYGRGYPGYYRGYGYGYPYGGYNDYGYYRPYSRRGWGISVGTPYYSDYGYSPGYYYSSPGYYSSGPIYSSGSEYAMEGTRSRSQSFYGGMNISEDQALIRVLVPDPNAEVRFEESVTKQTGTTRVFASPTLEQGRTYTYKIKASWTENGRQVKREKEIEVRPGQETVANFRERRTEGSSQFGERIREPATEIRERRDDVDIERRAEDGRSEERREERRESRSEDRSAERDANAHFGIVVRAANGELVMKQAGEEHSHRLASDAQIIVDGKKASLEDLKAGMQIEVTTKEGDKKVATKIEVKGSAGEGERDRQLPPE